MNFDGSRRQNASATRYVGLGSRGGGMQGARDRLRALQSGADDSSGEKFFVPESLARDCADDVLEVMRQLPEMLYRNPP